MERGFRFLKSPDFLVSSFFLKKPERIEALLMVMTLCLLVYAALEYKIRTKLRETGGLFKPEKEAYKKSNHSLGVFLFFRATCYLCEWKKNSSHKSETTPSYYFAVFGASLPKIVLF